MGEFIRVLLTASERAANIARSIRAEEDLFKLLIEEKESLKKNGKVVRDFKTLADVLIQESVRHDVKELFPELAGHIYGEESNLFTNSNGECVEISIGGTEEETQTILEKALCKENLQAAILLATEVHRSITLPNEDDQLQSISKDLIGSFSNLGIWIDPIDGTNEYIKGANRMDMDEAGKEDEKIFSEGGLPCATVLIGVFLRDSGSSIVGIINQPFWKFSAVTETWKGRYFWGLSIGSAKFSNVRPSCLLPKPSKPVIVISESEEKSFIERFLAGFELVQAPGAGYKILCVILGLADFYILSKSSTHLWDTCAPDAILKSLGGGIQHLQTLWHDATSEEKREISYKPDNPDMKARKYANLGGLFVFRDSTQVPLVLESLLRK